MRFVIRLVVVIRDVQILHKMIRLNIVNVLTFNFKIMTKYSKIKKAIRLARHIQMLGKIKNFEFTDEDFDIYKTMPVDVAIRRLSWNLDHLIKLV